jgi:putative transposase
LTKSCLIKHIGITRSKYYQWSKRLGIYNSHNGNIPRSHWLTDCEIDAITQYCRNKDRLGYRRLTYTMIDEDIAYTSPATVYRILKNAGLLNRWNAKSVSSKGNGFVQPEKPLEHLHMDISYVNILGTFFFLICVLDGFSRMILQHELRANMEEYDVEITLQRALEKYPEAKGNLISDNGSQFISRDFKDFIRENGLNHVRTSVNYPQSNGKMERFHQTIKEEKIRVSSFVDIDDARKQIDKYVDFYNNERLHSSIYYLTPKEVFDGKMHERLIERQNKLDKGRKLRVQLFNEKVNTNLFQV